MRSEDDQWRDLRRAYWTERAGLDGAGDGDAVGLVRVLIEAHAQTGEPVLLEEVGSVLLAAQSRFPNSVGVWEFSALLAARTNDADGLDRALAVLGRIDPGSRVVRMALGITEERSALWTDNATQTQLKLFQDLRSPDPAVVTKAVTELERWARAFPANSTYVVNYGLGLLASGRLTEAREVAAWALSVDDGSFEDAFNIAHIFGGTGDVASRRELLHEALRRAGSDKHQELALRALAQVEAG